MELQHKTSEGSVHAETHRLTLVEHEQKPLYAEQKLQPAKVKGIDVGSKYKS